MFTVTGVAKGTPFRVRVADDGTVTGSEAVGMLLERKRGTAYSVTPTHGNVVLSEDPTSILIALRTLTTVTATDGDVPDLFANDEPHDAETIY